MKTVIISFVVGVALVGVVNKASAQVIGVSLPMTGKYQKVAEDIKNGIVEAFEDAKQKNPKLEMVVADDQCDTKSAEIVAGKLSKADIIIGPTCFGVAVEVARIIRQEKQIPIITLNTRNKLLKYQRTYHNLQIFELSVEPDGEPKTIVSEGLSHIQNKPFAIIDDGSTHARNLSDEIRLLAEQTKNKPIAVESFRPLQETQAALIKRLQRAGVEAIIIAGSPEDIIVIINDMKKLGLKWPIIISEQAELIEYNQANFIIPKNTIIVKPKINKIGNLSDAYYEGHALMEIAVEAIGRQKHNQFNAPFDTIIGQTTFEGGRGVHKTFKLLKWDGQKFGE